MTIYLSIESQQTILFYQRIVFLGSSILNAFSMYCLLKKTSSNQGEVRSYLIAIQILVICSSIYTDLLFTPIFLFPAPGAYCLGLLCWAGVSPQVVMCGFLIIISLVGLTILSCIIYRHQTIIPQSSKFRFGKKMICAIQMLTLFLTPVLILIIYPMCTQDRHDLTRYGISWIVSRGPYFLHDMSFIVRAAIAAICFAFMVYLLPIVSLYSHMFYTLQSTPNKSSATVKSVRRSLVVLLVQLTVPITTITIPGFVGFLSPLVDFISFEVAINCYCIAILHPLVHNLLLLTVTPSFRRFITDTIMEAAEMAPKTSIVSTSRKESRVTATIKRP